MKSWLFCVYIYSALHHNNNIPSIEFIIPKWKRFSYNIQICILLYFTFKIKMRQKFNKFIFFNPRKNFKMKETKKVLTIRLNRCLISVWVYFHNCFIFHFWLNTLINEIWINTQIHIIIILFLLTIVVQITKAGTSDTFTV